MAALAVFILVTSIAIIFIFKDESCDSVSKVTPKSKFLDYDNLVIKSEYKPTCGTPYFHFPDDEFAHTYRGTLLIDPRIGEKITNGSLGKETYVQLCRTAAQSVAANLGETKVTLWWDKDDNDTPAKYRPFVIFGVQAYDYEEEDGDNSDQGEDDLQISLGNPTNEELEAVINKFDKITKFGYTTEYDN